MVRRKKEKVREFGGDERRRSKGKEKEERGFSLEVVEETLPEISGTEFVIDERLGEFDDNAMKFLALGGFKLLHFVAHDLRDGVEDLLRGADLLLGRFDLRLHLGITSLVLLRLLIEFLVRRLEGSLGKKKKKKRDGQQR